MATYSECFTKQTSAELDYMVDWGTARWLEVGDTIASSTWALPSGITKVSSTNTTTTATIIVSGGMARQTYNLVNTITTANGLVDSRTILLSVVQVGDANLSPTSGISSTLK